jgi:cytoskeletal protein CcmA (bactofilin family)
MSKLYGEIKTGKLAIEPGATFTGKCDMGAKKEINSEPITKPKEGPQ